MLHLLFESANLNLSESVLFVCRIFSNFASLNWD